MRAAIFVALLLAAGPVVFGRSFDLQRDTFAFANETAWQYGIDERGALHMSSRQDVPKYAHRCFVMTRAALQFWQFARFEPKRKRVSREEYTRLVRRVARIPVWSTGPRERIVIPGFCDLHEFSEVMPAVLQENLGAWLPTYLRVGNYRMALGHPRAGQAAAARWLQESLKGDRPRAIYVARFPHLNHCLIVFRQEARAGGVTRFWLYDPNYPGEAAWLDYLPGERSFALQPRWYFPGGRVNVMRVYLSPFH